MNRNSWIPLGRGGIGTSHKRNPSRFLHSERLIWPGQLRLWCLIILAGNIAACQPPVADSPLKVKGCKRCHAVTVDAAHNLACEDCHEGDIRGHTKAQAHGGLIARPAHPIHMEERCGTCHPEEVSKARGSTHFTLVGEVGAVWSAFFPEDTPPVVTALPVEEPPISARGLVADLLRRRCLRCHVYDEGDRYSGVHRGTGCAACHLHLQAEPSGMDHRFSRAVADSRCLTCHYANFVGWDFYGRFEKDHEEDYRAPLRHGKPLPRPYGLEWHEMTPDVHQQAEMHCTDCHPVGPCQGEERHAGCLDCHWGRDSGTSFGSAMAPMRPGHRSKDWARVSCAACHAVWTAEDRGRSLVRQDNPDYEFWAYLAVQGSSEVERVVWENLARAEGRQEPPLMRDKLDGKSRPGLWFQGFTERRWGPVRLGEDEHGRLSVLRPLLDLSLSYVDADGDVLFDNLRARSQGLRPYTPHTIGKADTFRALAVECWLEGQGRNGGPILEVGP